MYSAWKPKDRMTSRAGDRLANRTGVSASSRLAIASRRLTCPSPTPLDGTNRTWPDRDGPDLNTYIPLCKGRLNGRTQSRTGAVQWTAPAGLPIVGSIGGERVALAR